MVQALQPLDQPKTFEYNSVLFFFSSFVTQLLYFHSSSRVVINSCSTCSDLVLLFESRFPCACPRHEKLLRCLYRLSESERPLISRKLELIGLFLAGIRFWRPRRNQYLFWGQTPRRAVVPCCWDVFADSLMMCGRGIGSKAWHPIPIEQITSSRRSIQSSMKYSLA